MQTKNPTATENKSGGMSRRHFLGLTAGAIGLTMTPPMLAAAKTTSGGTALRSEWQQVRNMFSFSEGSVPMNAANLCPSFKQNDIVQFFKKQIEPGKTKLFTFTEVSNVSGLKLPAKELCAMAHQYDVFVHVDGAQSWGALDLDLKDMDCDSFAASSHKWFCGPKETGILYVKKKHATTIWPNTFGYTGHITVEMDLPDARRFETLGQRDDAALSAMLDAVNIHRTIGPKAIHDRVVYLADRLKKGLKKNGAKLVTPESPDFSHGVVIIDIPEDHRAAVSETLYNKFGIAGSPTGGMRLCPHIYNTDAHVDRAVAGLKQTLSTIS